MVIFVGEELPSGGGFDDRDEGPDPGLQYPATPRRWGGPALCPNADRSLCDQGVDRRGEDFILVGESVVQRPE